MNFRLTLLISQIYVHILFFIGLFLAPWYISIPAIILSDIVFVGLCGTVFYHRVISHKNYINPYLKTFLLFLSWIGISGSLVAWAGTHRKHHRYTDTDKDPHSPQHMGYLKTYWWSSGGDDVVRYVPDLLRDKLNVWQHKNYFRVLLVLHVIIATLLPFVWYWALFIVPPFLMWFAGSITNCLSHDDTGPINRFVLGILFAGEGWHKNHHDNAADPSFNHPLDWGHWIYRWIR